MLHYTEICKQTKLQSPGLGEEEKNKQKQNSQQTCCIVLVINTV